MYLHPFHQFLPDIAARETRAIVIEELPYLTAEALPHGEYQFHEYYCAKRKSECDCRRVTLVPYFNLSQEPLASISFGFDRDGDMPGPFLDPFGSHSPYEDELLQLAEKYLFSDQSYLARLERHYEMMKAVIAGRDPEDFLPLTPERVAVKLREKAELKKQRIAMRRKQSQRQRPK